MIRIGLRDARSHFGRFIMSIVAIALGVSFVVGSFCFREMLNNQVSQMMSTNADHDVYVRGSQEKKKDSSAMSMGSTKSYNDVDVDLAGTIAKVDGVSSARVVHMLSGVVLLDKHGVSDARHRHGQVVAVAVRQVHDRHVAEERR